MKIDVEHQKNQHFQQLKKPTHDFNQPLRPRSSSGFSGDITLHKGLRVLLASTAAFVSLPAFAWLAAELAAYYEMFATGMNSRSELGDDLGFGILLFMVVPPFTLAGVAFIWWLIWSRTGRSKTTHPNGRTNA